MMSSRGKCYQERFVLDVTWFVPGEQVQYYTGRYIIVALGRNY